MKVRYKGENIIPIGLAVYIIASLTNGNIYEVVKYDDKYFYIIDDKGNNRTIEKEKCEVVE